MSPKQFVRLSLPLWMIMAVAIAKAEDRVLDLSFEMKKVVTDCSFAEGPTMDASGNLYFSDSPNDRIVQLSTDGTASTYLSPCGAANGMLIDQQGRFLICQSSRPGGGRALGLVTPKREIVVLTDSFQDNPYIAPNDLTVDGQGRIYFTDPFYSGEKSQPNSGVYRYDGPGKVTLLIDDLLKPNGIVMTPDGKKVYISDRGTQKLHRYLVQSDGSLKPDGIQYNFAPDRGIDGMWLDVEGNIYGAAGEGETTGLFVISPAGKLIHHIRTGDFATNVTIGGPDRRDVYVTVIDGVYKLRTTIPGAQLPRLQGQPR